jgi:transposase, IS5 family
MALLNSLERNCSLETMGQINQVIDWAKVEERLRDYGSVGTKEEVADAYPPWLLSKGLLLQKCFHVPSDPEPENQIDGWHYFKEFLELPFDHPSPDHSTFSHFRSRLSKEALIWIHNEILEQFAQKGLTINQGMAIDA